MESISNIPSYIDAVLAAVKPSSIQKASGAPNHNIVPNIGKISQDVKNNIVTEKQSDIYDPTAYNLRFQQRVPLSSLIETNQTFNEINKPYIGKKILSKAYGSHDSNSDQQIDSGINENKSLGYYLVYNSSQENSSRSTPTKASNPVYERINKAYHLNILPEPGTLVNVIYF